MGVGREKVVRCCHGRRKKLSGVRLVYGVKKYSRKKYETYTMCTVNSSTDLKAE
jgi:hypothetical protein